MSLSPIIKKPPEVSITHRKAISSGVTVCQLKTGELVLSAHEGEQRILVDLTPDELASFVHRLGEFQERAKAFQAAQQQTSSAIQA